MKDTGKTNRKDKQDVLRNSQFIKTALLFCAVAVFFDLLFWYLGKNEYLAFLDIFISWIMTGLIQLSGIHAVRDSNTIYLTNTTWIVTTECTAIFIMLIFSSFVFVYPASMKQKSIALLAGIPFIFGANVLRLFTMAWIDKIKPQYSAFFHDYMWQVAFILMVVWMWMVWIDRVVNSETKISVSA